jgi:hypothetical protein
MATGNFIVQNGLQVGGLTIDAATGSIVTTGNIGTTSTAFTQIAVGTSSERPGTPTEGQIRYNSTISSFEGYGAGAAWSSLGGVKSVDGKAYIQAETSAGAADDVIRVYAGDSGVSTQVMWASTSNVKVLPTTSATSTTTGALQVAGGLGVAGNVWVGGNLYVANLISTSTTTLTISDPMVYLTASGTYNYDIGMYSDYTAPGYRHTGVVRDVSSNVWAFFSNLASEPGSTINWSDVGIAYDTVKVGELVSANTTAATSTSTGALRVAGGAGIGKALYVGGDGTNSIVHTGHIIPSANASYNLGSSSAWYGTLYGLATQAKYADLAENYQADAYYAPGQVLEFGGEKEVTLAVADTKRVAGVVSTNPAHLMNGGLTGSNVVPLALTGRVPCNVIGPVAKGDLMVSAGFGYAKTNNDAHIGQVIGKALADFTGAKGQIEVVVGRF